MFYNCKSLSSLDLSMFDTSNAKNMTEMFYGCENLEYINLQKFSDNNLIKFEKIFYGIPENIVACIIINNAEKIFQQINNKSCYILDCTKDWKSKQKKIIIKTGQCVENCSTSPYENEFNLKCVQTCPNEKYEENKINICKCPLQQCLSCSPVALMNNLCTKCNDNYYPIENDPINLAEYINCYQNPPSGYYLNLSDKQYKKCYHSCSSCTEKGDYINHNCLSCNNYYNLTAINNNYYNCYMICPYYYYFDEKDNKTYCTLNESCTKDYPKLILIQKNV